MALGARSDLVSRMIWAGQLDATLYEEVEADEGATGQAALVVLLVGLLGGLAAGLSPAAHGRSVLLISHIIGGGVGALVGWVVWAYITYFVGTQLFGGTATPGEMLRTLGFAQSPGVLRILAFVPILGWLVSLVLWIWILVAGVIAVRQALDFSTDKAIFTVVIGWLVNVAIGVVLAVFMGVFVALIFGAAAVGGALAR